MGNAITIIIFLILIYGLGYSVTRFLKKSDNLLEKNLMNLGIGLGVFSFLSVVFGVLGVPLDWKIFLPLSLILPIYDLVKNKNKINLGFKPKKSDIYILIVIVLALILLFVFLKGTFNYPWFEDDDSWKHAIGAKYVSVEKGIPAAKDEFQYMNPYPPAYDIIMGILHQTNDSIYWTLKFFNSLIIALGIIFFYFFVKEFTDNKNKALFSTFILFSIPCFLSHFIWAHSLVTILFFPAMYCLERIKYDKNWWWVGALVIAAIPLVQPTKMIKLGIMFGIYFIVKWIYLKKFNWHLFGSIAMGYLLSLIWWWNHWTGVLLPRVSLTSNAAEQTGSFITRLYLSLKEAFPPTHGSATRAYSFKEIFLTQHQNMINNPIGIGLFISLLLLLAVISFMLLYKNLKDEKSSWRIIVLLWAIFTFLGFNSATFNLPFGFFGFRFWMLFAICASILSAEGLWFLFSLFKKYKMFILIIVIVGVLLTSAHQKYSVNTATWSPGIGWKDTTSIQSYIWMNQNFKPDTMVFSFSSDIFVIGFDLFECSWCEDEKTFREGAINKSASDIAKFLKSKKYEYLIIDGRTANKLGLNVTNEKVEELINSNQFRPLHSTESSIVFKVL